eukprot:TRINITY_DN2682_c0_g1_i3.p1 TRINITY_DN2682_c0_g1~~TRINITY_DN2682_c0_g1_i3.p1  ORF type:complete len:1013 (-),score=251.98 TRINITY_DN2682_c0_g1_i3:98-3136(-)
MADGQEETVAIDDSLYSRQRYVLGDKAMSRMAKSDVLILGLGGLGVEIAKNIALAGVKSLTLHDTVEASLTDLATQFFLSEADIGKNRATVSEATIAQLNPYVKVASFTTPIGEDLGFLQKYSCVIATELPLSQHLRINEYCHAHNICYIAAEIRGVFAWIFDDFGESFDVWDKNGEEPSETLIAKITKEKEGVVTCLEHHFHGLEDGDVVTFREVKGMTEINGTHHAVKVISPTSFAIGDTSAFGDYERDGAVVQVKTVVKHSFLRMAESLEKPELNIVDFAKMENSQQLHIGFQALHAFVERRGGLPAPWNAADAEQLITIAEEINNKTAAKVNSLNKDLLKQLSFTSRGVIAPITGFLGGVVAQEALKAVTGKYTPLKQWLYFDACELLPSLSEAKAEDFLPVGSRYDSQIICIGKSTQKAIEDAKLFMIGCGAIGCEMLKNYAMLGVSAGNGKIVVTDNDLIEKSNLNRQFLFRPNNIGSPKSTTAANAAKVMNPNLKIEANLDRVGPQTEEKYSDDFFEELDVVVNALDNVAARIYVDGRCVTNQRPLLESGTLATKGHVQVIVPYKTESYSSQRDPPEKDVPFCTLKSFPNQIEHTIQWARDFCFENLFSSKPREFNKFWEDATIIEKINNKSTKPGTLRPVAKLLSQRPESFNKCIEYGRLKFERYYRNSILQLLHNFPLDHKMNDGSLFWTSPKRPPTPQEFDSNNKLHFDFIVSFANLWADVWGLPKPSSITPASIDAALANLKIPVFQPKSGKQIITDENAKKPEPTVTSDEEHEEEARKALIAYLSKDKPPKLNPLDFEKDDDSNFHIDFITASSNLRATVYAIQVADRLQTKRIAGRIMPAIATTTAAVSGLVGIELIKLLKKESNLEKYKNAFMNLGISLFAFSEPAPVISQKISSTYSFSLWDRWDIKQPDITVADFTKYFQSKYGLTVTGIFQDVTMIYVPHFPAHKKRLPDPLAKWLKRPNDSVKYLDLIVSFENDDEEEVNGPVVRFHFTGDKKQ